MPARVITVCFATVCWVAGVFASALAGREPLDAFMIGFGALLVGWLVGWLAGVLMQATVDDALEQHRQANPIPEEDALDAGSADEIVV